MRLSFAARAALIYGICAGLWILLSDRALDLLIWDAGALSTAQTYKGWGFVFVTSLLLFATLRSEQASRRRVESDYRNIYENALDGFFQSTPGGRFRAVNPAMARIYGYASPEEMLTAVTDIGTQIHLSQENRQRFVEILERQNTVERFEAPNMRKDRSIIWTSTSARAVRDAAGQTLYFEGIVEDITDRKRMELSLREAESRYREIVEQIPASVYTDAVDEVSSNLYSSPQVLALTGYTPEEWVADPELWQRVLHPDDRERALSAYSAARQQERDYNLEYRILTRDGRLVWIRDYAKLLKNEKGDPLYWQGIMVDISDQKRADEAARQSEERFTRVFQSSPVPTCITTWSEGQLVDVNSAYLGLSGYAIEELIGKSVVDPGFSDGRQRAAFLERLAENGSLQGVEGTFRNKQGRSLETFAFHERIRLNDQDCILSMFYDITEQKRMQDALAGSEKRFRSLIENSMDAIALTAADGTIVFQSPAAGRMLGYAAQEMVGRNVLEFMHLGDRRPAIRMLRQLRRTPDAVPVLEIRALHRDGSHRWVEVIASNRLQEPGVEAVVANYRDVTERKRAEEDLHRREAILGAIAYAADRFLKTEKWQNNILAILERLGTVSATSRVYIFQKVFESGANATVTLLYEWCCPEIEPQMDRPESRQLDLRSAGLQRWIQRFEQGETMYGIVRELPEQEQPEFRRGRILSLVCVPIMIGKTWWGYIGFDDCATEREWTPNEIDALRTSANILSAAIQREQATEAVQKQLRELTMLHGVALASSSASSLDELIQRITNIIGDTLVPDNYGVLLVTPGGDALRPHPSYKGVDETNLNAIIGLGQGITGRAALTGMPMRVGDVVNASDYIQISAGIRSELSVPILSAGTLIGVLNLESRQPEAFSEADERLLNTIAGGMGTAIERLRLFEAQKRRARESDSLREATSALTRSLDLPTLLEITLDLLPNFAPFDSASIMLKEPDEGMSIVAVRGLPGDFLGRRFGRVSGWLVQPPLHEPLILRDAQADTRFERVPGTEYIRGWMAVPLLANEELIGLLNLDSRDPDTYSNEHAVLVQTFANQAAVAIQNARLFESEQQRRQEAENLRVAAAAITSSLDSKQVLETILVALKQVVPYDSAAMLLLDGDSVRITAAKGLPFPQLALNQTFPASNRLLTTIHASGQPLILEDAREDPRFERWAAGDKIRGWMGVPLLIRGQIIGFITLDSYTAGSFDERSASLAQTFAHQAAAAIDNARLFGETRRRLGEMETVSRISFGLRAALRAEEMLPILFSEVLDLMNTDTGSIWLFEESTGMLVQKMAAGWSQSVPVARVHPGEGIAGHVYRSGEAYPVSDFVSDPQAHPENRKSFPSGWNGIALPIRTSDALIGAMVIAVPNPRRVEAHQIQLMSTIAEIAGNSIHRVNLYVRSEDQVRRLIALRDVDMAIAGSFDLRVTLNILLDHIVSQLQVDATAIQAFNPDMQVLTPLANLGFRRQANAQATLRISEGPASKILIDRSDVHIYDPDHEGEFRRREQLTGEGFVSYYATPLVSKGQTKGILETFFRRAFHPDSYWLEFLHAMAGQAAIAIDNAQLFENLQRSNQELSLAYDTTLEGWGKALELRDKETQGHTQRVTELTVRLARRLGVPESELTHVRRGVLLHDIGKMGVPDQILKKTGPLTEAEWEEMRRHPKYAYDLLYPIAYLRPALEIPYYHHERWDGSGYPRGLKGEDIPLAARIFAVVDVWDALLYDRPYRRAWPREDVLEYLRARAGSRFDAAVVREFLRMVVEDDGQGGSRGPGATT